MQTTGDNHEEQPVDLPEMGRSVEQADLASGLLMAVSHHLRLLLLARRLPVVTADGDGTAGRFVGARLTRSGNSPGVAQHSVRLLGRLLRAARVRRGGL